MGLLDWLGGGKPAAAAPAPAAQEARPAPTWPQGAVAQLVGADAITVMFDPGYSVEKYLPQLLAQGPDGQPLKYFKSVTGGGMGNHHRQSGKQPIVLTSMP